MTISFLISNLSNSGGTQRMLTLLCNELINQYNITIFVHQKGASFFELDNRVNVALLKGNLLQKNIQVYKSLKKSKTKYYINLDSNSVLLNGFLLPSFTKLIIWEHFSLENNYKKLLFSMSRFYTSFRAKKIIVLSEIEKQLWSKQYYMKKEKIKVIYNPITFTVCDEDKNNRFNNKTILAIGNNIKVKGFDILLKAWQKIKTDWNLHIVGLNKNDIKELKTIITHLQLNNVEIFSKTSNIKSFYKQSSAFVLSSRKEATPLVLIESQALGLPVLTFNHLSSVKEIGKDSVMYLNFDETGNGLAGALKTLTNSEKKFTHYHKLSIKNSEYFHKDNFINNWLKIIK